MNGNQWIALLAVMSCSFVGAVILLNMLVALMNDTYDSVMQLQKEERLKAKCHFMNEYNFLFNRARYFTNTKYIIIAQLDNIVEENGEWEGKIESIKSQISSRLKADQLKQQLQFKQMKLVARNLQS